VKSDQEWKYWGAADPLFAVASWEGKQAGSRNAWTSEEFLALGRSDVADVAKHWRSYGLIEGRCVEIGCGAGRMTNGLLAIFPDIEALDVSPDQIATAQRLLGDLAGRVRFHVVDRPAIPLPDQSCDAMFSTHVFQHFSDYSAIEAYLADTFRVLRPGSSICFHLPVPGAHLTAPASLPRRIASRLKISLKRLLGMRRVMEYHRYPPDRVLRTLAQVGFAGGELRIFPMSSNGDYHSFFFARRP
jgi:SAM-dependent methyltransferase